METDPSSAKIAVLALLLERKTFIHSSEVLLHNEMYELGPVYPGVSKEYQVVGAFEEAIAELVRDEIIQEIDTATLLEEVIRSGRFVNEDFPGVKVSELAEADDGGFFMTVGPRLPFYVLENFSEIIEECEVNEYPHLRDYSYEIATGSEAYVPGSDRIVTRKDNSEAFADIDDTLSELETRLLRDNAAAASLGDDREVALAEVGLLRSLIAGAKARVSVLTALSKRTLGWIADKCAGAAVGELAKQALVHILRLFG